MNVTRVLRGVVRTVGIAGAIVPVGMVAIHVLTGHSSIAINLRGGLIFGGICGTIGAALAAISLGSRGERQSFPDTA